MILSIAFPLLTTNFPLVELSPQFPCSHCITNKYDSDQATNQVCQKVGVGRRRRCAGHPWEEHHHLDFEMDLISQDFPNRKGAVGVGNVNVQVVVKLAKDLSAGFQFGAMIIRR